ncbi:hypothetical protein [Aquisphaera insulae]|uniref:hypothetical protein n=1 Tax=Aquisphaera insulae TaxID=2712864 RepID=UPI0013EB3315|nr:hypothetical protein [Aquisphaera insulae]
MLSRNRTVGLAFRRWIRAGVLAAATSGTLGGCNAVSRDVHQYYQQMAINYKEAEDKARFKASLSDSESKMLLKAGEVHKAGRARKEADKLNEWADRCAHQRERFQKAADKLEPRAEGDGIRPPDPVKEVPADAEKP